MNKEIEEIALQTHIKWLSKAKTAKINGQEMTVLPYGYLQTAVREAIQQERERIIKEIKARMPSHDCVQEYLQTLSEDSIDNEQTEEIPQMKGTREELDGITIKKQI